MEPHQPNKRIALDSTDLNSTNLTFSAVPKSEVMTALQPIQSSNTVSLSAMIPQPSSSSASFSTLRLVTPSTFINSSEISTCKSILILDEFRIKINFYSSTFSANNRSTNFASTTRKSCDHTTTSYGKNRN